MYDLETLMGYFESICEIGYGNRLPGKSDEMFSQLAILYLSADEDERAIIREALPERCRSLMIGYSDRMAILAERMEDRKYLLRSFAAHSIEDFRYDERENIVRLALTCHVASVMGEDSTRLLKHVSKLSSRRGSTAFDSFSQRPAELNTLKTMNILKKETPDGIDYEYQQ